MQARVCHSRVAYSLICRPRRRKLLKALVGRVSLYRGEEMTVVKKVGAADSIGTYSGESKLCLRERPDH